MMAQQVVQEIPGIYGSVRVEEIILQCIWAEQDFCRFFMHGLVQCIIEASSV